jgi:hypothetical protein
MLTSSGVGTESSENEKLEQCAVSKTFQISILNSNILPPTFIALYVSIKKINIKKL